MCGHIAFRGRGKNLAAETSRFPLDELTSWILMKQWGSQPSLHQTKTILRSDRGPETSF